MIELCHNILASRQLIRNKFSIIPSVIKHLRISGLIFGYSYFVFILLIAPLRLSEALESIVCQMHVAGAESMFVGEQCLICNHHRTILIARARNFLLHCIITVSDF